MPARADIAILLPNLDGGGAERIALTLARYWAAESLSVQFVVSSRSGVLLSEVEESFEVGDLGGARIRSLLLPLMRYIKARNPRSILVSMWPLTILAILAVKLTRSTTRVVVSEHALFSVREVAPGWVSRSILNLTLRVLFPFADRIIAVSDGVAADIAVRSGLPRARIQRIYNPIPHRTTSIAPENSFTDLRWLNSKYRVLAVGSLKEVKDFSTLLRAFSRFRTTVEAKLLILGEGPERAQLESLARTLGIADDIEMPGFTPHLDIFYEQADLFVLSSLSEGFGNVLVEAMRAGLPVVSTDCEAGPREILSPELAHLVPVGSPDAMAEAMVQAFAAPPDSRKVIQWSQRFQPEAAVRAYTDALLG